MVKTPLCGCSNFRSNGLTTDLVFFPNDISLDIMYFDDYRKIRNDFFLIFVIDKNSLKNIRIGYPGKQLNMLAVFVYCFGPLCTK